MDRLERHQNSNKNKSLRIVADFQILKKIIGQVRKDSRLIVGVEHDAIKIHASTSRKCGTGPRTPRTLRMLRRTAKKCKVTALYQSGSSKNGRNSDKNK